MRIHLLALPHSKVNKDRGVCAFSQKVLKMSQMLSMLGYEFFVYWVEGSECENFVQTMSDIDFKRIYPYDHKISQIDWNNKEGRELFNKNTIEEINKRKQPWDIVLCSYGRADKTIVDWVWLPAVELGIGYPASNKSRHRIFESYARMHTHYGKEWTMHPNNYDEVIPAYFDVQDFSFVEQPTGEYAFRIWRPNEDKGRRLAVEVCKKAWIQLLLAGQEKDRINAEIKAMWAEGFAKHIWYVGTEERSKFLGNAMVTFVPSLYVEPFWSVHIESLLCWTPIITTDFWAFPENNIHGKTWFRCRLFNDYVKALENVHSIDRSFCRKYAENNYSLEVISKRYDTFFKRLQDLYNGGWRYSDNVPVLDVSKTL